MLRIIRFSCIFTVVAVTLQCVGCAVETSGTDTSDPQSALRLPGGEHPGDISKGPDDSAFASVSLARHTGTYNPAVPASAHSPYLLTESAFIEDGAISTESSDPILESRALFSRAFDRMREDEKKSLEAQDLAKHYRTALERAVGMQGIVEDLTCGLSLCMGLVSAKTREDHDGWDDRLYEDPSAVRHVILQTIEMSGDRLQNRFLFSTDSAIKAIALPPKRDR